MVVAGSVQPADITVSDTAERCLKSSLQTAFTHADIPPHDCRIEPTVPFALQNGTLPLRNLGIMICKWFIPACYSKSTKVPQYLDLPHIVGQALLPQDLAEDLSVPLRRTSTNVKCQTSLYLISGSETDVYPTDGMDVSILYLQCKRD